jgi:hypothetical protein
MSKKIQVSTVRQTADVEVVFINANLISKVIKAQSALDRMLDGTRTPCVQRDENGNDVVDENGKPVYVKDDAGNIIYEYGYRGIREQRDIADLHEKVKSLIDELVNAFDA